MRTTLHGLETIDRSELGGTSGGIDLQRARAAGHEAGAASVASTKAQYAALGKNDDPHLFYKGVPVSEVVANKLGNAVAPLSRRTGYAYGYSADVVNQALGY